MREKMKESEDNPIVEEELVQSPLEGEKEMTKKEENQWGMFAHLSALLGYFIPLGNIAGPFVIWTLYKDKSEFVANAAKESLNFQISLTIAVALAGISVFALIGVLLLPAVMLFGLVYVVIAAVQANEGKDYKYPITYRFV